MADRADTVAYKSVGKYMYLAHWDMYLAHYNAALGSEMLERLSAKLRYMYLF